MENAVGDKGVSSTDVRQFDPAAWRKAFASEPNGGNCVEVNFSAAKVGLRDSKLADSPVFVFAPGEWLAFATAVTSS